MFLRLNLHLRLLLCPLSVCLSLALLCSSLLLCSSVAEEHSPLCWAACSTSCSPPTWHLTPELLDPAITVSTKALLLLSLLLNVI